MRVLVVGRYPPDPAPAARRALAEVSALVAAGDEVEVLSPRPSAAHHHGRVVGAMAAAGLARWSRRFDHLVLRLDPGVAVRPRVAGADVVALAGGLRPWKRVTLVVDDLGGLGVQADSRAAQALWRRAGTIVVPRDGDRARLVGAGVPEAKVVVRPLAVAGAVAVPLAPPPAAGAGDVDDAGATRLALMSRMRASSAGALAEFGPWPLPPDSGPPPVPKPTTAVGWGVWLVKKTVRTTLGRNADVVLGPIFRARLAVAERLSRK